MAVKYDPNQRDWSPQELKEYFSFNLGLATTDPDSIYFGELITLYNPNIKRNTIEPIPERIEEAPRQVPENELKGLRNLLSSDMTLMANRYQIKRVEPPTE